MLKTLITKLYFKKSKLIITATGTVNVVFVFHHCSTADRVISRFKIHLFMHMQQNMHFICRHWKMSRNLYNLISITVCCQLIPWMCVFFQDKKYRIIKAWFFLNSFGWFNIYSQNFSTSSHLFIRMYADRYIWNTCIFALTCPCLYVSASV